MPSDPVVAASEPLGAEVVTVAIWEPLEAKVVAVTAWEKLGAKVVAVAAWKQPGAEVVTVAAWEPLGAEVVAVAAWESAAELSCATTGRIVPPGEKCTVIRNLATCIDVLKNVLPTFSFLLLFGGFPLALFCLVAFSTGCFLFLTSMETDSKLEDMYDAQHFRLYNGRYLFPG